MNTPLSNEDVPALRKWWHITITGYGSFEYFGSEFEAKEARDAKAAWEGGNGRLRASNLAEIDEARKQLQWEIDAGYPKDEREMAGLGSVS